MKMNRFFLDAELKVKYRIEFHLMEYNYELEISYTSNMENCPELENLFDV